YSPEYVALLAANKIGAAVVFMDLPHYAQIKQAEPRPRNMEREEERLIVESGFYQHLAKAAGYRSWNEAWDSLFEMRDFGNDYEKFRRELATFWSAACVTAPSERIEQDGTLEREGFMMRTIRDHLQRRKVKPQQAMVVCGGFHLFLDRDDATPPPETPPG